MKTVWDSKDSISAECHFNPRELAEMLKKSKLSQGEKTVDLHELSNKEMRVTGFRSAPTST